MGTCTAHPSSQELSFSNRTRFNPAIKERLRAVTDEALGRGIFGSPFVIVDGEPFWGVDRLPMVDEWLRRGGW